jgi:hypothetical protein
MLRLPLQVSFLSREIGNVRLRNFVYVVATRRNIEETDFVRNTGTEGITSLPVTRRKEWQSSSSSSTAQHILPSGFLLDGIGAFISNFTYCTVVNSLNFSNYFLIIYSVYIGTSSHLVYRYCFRILYWGYDTKRQTIKNRLPDFDLQSRESDRLAWHFMWWFRTWP